MQTLATWVIVITFVGSIIFAVWGLFWWLWNEIAAEIFGAPELTFWQAVGLLVLIGLLTSGLRRVSSGK